MVIISVNDKTTIRGYGKTQFRYAMIYVLITTVMMLILNIYSSRLSQQLFYQSKQSAMIEKCQIASDEISTLDVLNHTNVAEIVNQLESLKITRMIVTDQYGNALFEFVPLSAIRSIEKTIRKKHIIFVMFSFSPNIKRP